jgi:hypothetical protein
MQNFTLKFSFLLALLFSASVSMAQITTVGIIGSATANGWNASTPMTSLGNHEWSIALPLMATAGANEVKFRANDAWTINWGATGFPTGTGTQDGPNIPVAAAGNYAVRFNDQTGAYSFSVLAAAKSSSESVLKMALAPNPASGSVSVVYNLPAATAATVTVQNLLGQTVRQLAPMRQGLGLQRQELGLQGLAAGIYLVQLHTADHAQTARLVVE